MSRALAELRIGVGQEMTGHVDQIGDGENLGHPSTAKGHVPIGLGDQVGVRHVAVGTRAAKTGVEIAGASGAIRTVRLIEVIAFTHVEHVVTLHDDRDAEISDRLQPGDGSVEGVLNVHDIEILLTNQLLNDVIPFRVIPRGLSGHRLLPDIELNGRNSFKSLPFDVAGRSLNVDHGEEGGHIVTPGSKGACQLMRVDLGA